MPYVLANSNIKTTFSIVNLKQYVIKKTKQIYIRGIIPDFNINQTFNDYLNQEDTQINFTINLIEKKKIETLLGSTNNLHLVLFENSTPNVYLQSRQIY